MSFKYYKDQNNQVYAFEADGSQDAYIKPELTLITKAQADALRVPATAIPSVISMRQARRALLQSGLLAQVDAAIAAMTGAAGDAARIDWQFAQTVERTHPLVGTMTTQLSLTEKQLDDLFTLGATL
ncbi:hypothetical protein SAMN05216404_106141 [Nitrosospira multiformis]|uniref:Uncharacterized protein n=1 Tax=Nitrosospira multiformis TaxID=1231 RepID=A0A1H8IRD8_9PROT|nr:hypothetical protein [Nitrosospira multiformis]SEN70567.1 hypothetical protein SAMN05216404_106141 [Nitrosospira multiformis]